MNLPSLLSALLAVALFPAGAAYSQGAATDGTVTYDLGASRSFPNYPGLPPNSDDLVYDSGDYTGTSRNLQNPNIFPGWPYWAHQVRFTPLSTMHGRLLEVRYVAVVQWGANRNFDLVIRDAAGNVVRTMPNLTAVIDSGNWQVIDVSSLNFVPGGADFYVEFEPSNPCGGNNGFTIPFSSLGSSRSAFSSDCANPSSSFAVEARDLFLRAVVELSGGPTLSVTNLTAGATATLTVNGATAGGAVGVAFSVAGPGPTSAPAGPCGTVTVNLSAPVQILPLLTANGSGTATVNQAVPAGATGVAVWLHALDVGSCTLTNSLALVIG